MSTFQISITGDRFPPLKTWLERRGVYYKGCVGLFLPKAPKKQIQKKDSCIMFEEEIPNKSNRQGSIVKMREGKRQTVYLYPVGWQLAESCIT